MADEQELFDQLAFYTLAHGHPRFLHQHAVDAFAAQTANDETKTIAIFFGLMGLYLLLEKKFTGRQVQLAHMRLAKLRRVLPRPALPVERGAIRVADVLVAEPGEPRDQAIEAWCATVWNAYAEAQHTVRAFVKLELAIS